jgi:hypothetical protein
MVPCKGGDEGIDGREDALRTSHPIHPLRLPEKITENVSGDYHELGLQTGDGQHAEIPVVLGHPEAPWRFLDAAEGNGRVKGTQSNCQFHHKNSTEISLTS